MNKWKKFSHRVTRKQFLSKPLKRTTYRKIAYPCLLKDFEERCAYSMTHRSNCGEFEIDHFDATRKKDLVQDYCNLFPAHPICNRSKSNKPTKRELREGKRFLNPCREWDYNEHICENSETPRINRQNQSRNLSYRTFRLKPSPFHRAEKGPRRSTQNISPNSSTSEVRGKQF